MILNDYVVSDAIIYMGELSKFIKASLYAYYIFDDNSITVYGAQDIYISIVSRIVVPNITNIRGTMVYPTTAGLYDFCKTLIPQTKVSITNGILTDMYKNTCIPITELETEFLSKIYSINTIVNNTPDIITLDIEPTICSEIKSILYTMRSTDSQVMKELFPGHLITIYPGMLPINKADILSISVITSINWFMCKYTIYKKKCPAPIDVFIKYIKV